MKSQKLKGHDLKKTTNKQTAFLIVLILLFIALADVRSDTLPKNPYAGQKIFNEKGCITCHSISGTGGTEGPDLSDRKFQGTFLGFAAIMWNHAPDMLKKAKALNLSIAQLDEEEVAQLIAYLCFLRYSGKRGNIFIGNKLLHAKGCLDCHSTGESPKKVGPNFNEIDFYISPLYLAQAMWNHGPNIYLAEKEKGIKHIKLEGGEINDIAAALNDFVQTSMSKTEYSTFGDIEIGEALYRQKGCANCHESRRTDSAPDLKKTHITNGVLEIAEAMWNYGPMMWQKMSEQKIDRPVFQGSDMADLISYIFYMQYLVNNGDPQKGKDVFQRKSCNSCHFKTMDDTGQISGEKIPILPVQTSIDMIQDMWNHSHVMQEKMQDKKIKWPKFNEGEMMDLYTFLSQEK